MRRRKDEKQKGENIIRFINIVNTLVKADTVQPIFNFLTCGLSNFQTNKTIFAHHDR